ncbi:MAG TPA: OmpA family protein, partial [Burkholderiales bacterium]|nr:OmpA family protein [Burkholderiales bacterium]
HMKKLVLALSALTTFSLAAHAQTGPVLKGKDITESALINALTPEEPEIRTRSFKRDPSAPPPAPAKPASASLLITFETNSAELTNSAKHALDKVGKALKSDKLSVFKFDIEGHADPRGGGELNQQLSQARAEAVREYLVQSHQVPSERLKAIGKGSAELINAKDLAAPENRRVTIKTVME